MVAKIIDRDSTGRTVMVTGRISFGETLQEAKGSKAQPDNLTHGANLIILSDRPDFDKQKAVIIQALKNTCKEAGRPENWWKGLYDDDPKQLCFRKGERFKDKDGKVYLGYENNLIIVGKGPKAGKARPGKMMDRHKRPVEIKDINDVFYNGTLADMQVAFYYTDKHGPARITCSIEGIRSHQEGERLGGGGTYVDEDDFDTLEEDDSFDSGPATGGSKSDDDLIL